MTWKPLCKTTARTGEVVCRIHGPHTGGVNPPTIRYFRVIDEEGHGKFYGPKRVIETTYEDYKTNGVDK